MVIGTERRETRCAWRLWFPTDQSIATIHNNAQQSPLHYHNSNFTGRAGQAIPPRLPHHHARRTLHAFPVDTSHNDRSCPTDRLSTGTVVSVLLVHVPTTCVCDPAVRSGPCVAFASRTTSHCGWPVAPHTRCHVRGERVAQFGIQSKLLGQLAVGVFTCNSHAPQQRP